MFTYANTHRRSNAYKQTNLSLGDPTEAVIYEVVSHQEDPRGRMHESRGVLQKNVKDMIKKSSLHLGDYDPKYQSVARESTEHAVKYAHGQPLR